MPGGRANSDGGNGHGDQPFTADWFIPNTTMTTASDCLDFKDPVLLAEFNHIARMLDWDNTDTNRLSRGFSSDHLNYRPYVQWPYPSSMPTDYWNPGYIPIPEPNYWNPINLNAKINGTDTNLSDKNHSNVNNSDINPGSTFDNNESVTAVKYSLKGPYNLTVDSPWSKGAVASEFVSNEVVVEGILASKVSHTSEIDIADVQVTKNDISRRSCMSCHVHKNGPAKDSKFLGKETVSSLIVTMHNLSELLLHQWSSEMCELREQDLESLEKVVDNLNKFMLKKNGRESVSKLHQGISIGKHSGNKDDTFSDSVSVETGSDMTTMIDKSDQTVKVLIKNLHEKEAHCDNMKIEMEECKPDNGKDVDEHSISELDGIDKLANKVNDSPVSQTGTACNSDSDDYYDEFDDSDFGDEFDDDDEEEEVAAADDDDEDKVFHSVMLADCCSDWEFVSDEELSGLNGSS